MNDCPLTRDLTKDLTTEQEIYKAMETNILVFSSQIVADSYVYSCAKKNGSAFKDRAISWDRFREKFSQIPKEFTQADDTDKSLFVKYWSEHDKENFEKLRYFADFSYKEAIPAFKRSIARQVSQLCTAYESSDTVKEELYNQNPSKELMNDIHLIVLAYREYLKNHKLYDLNLITPNFQEAQDYVLVFPETFKDPHVKQAAKYCRQIKNPTKQDPFFGFEIYNNSVSEIRNTMRNIRQLLQDGTNPSDIAISCSDLETYRPYLEYEAHIRDIELEFQDARPLSQLPPGRFIKLFFNARKTRGDYRSLRAFILDTMVPFKDRETYPQIISEANKLKIANAPFEIWLAKLQKEKNEEITNAFQRLVENFDNFDGQIRTDKVSEALMTFSKAVLEDKYWTTTDEQMPNGTFAAVFGSCIDELKKLETKSPNLGKEEIIELYEEVLDNVKYLENRKTMGLKVYNFPVSCGLCIEHHFVLNLSDKAVVCYRDSYPFIQDRNSPAKEDIGHEILKTYLLSNAVLSGCEESFSGPMVMPTEFLEKGRNLYKTKQQDSFDNEGLTDCIMPYAQKEGFERNRDICSNYSDKEEFAKPLLPFNMSISKIKDFELCPYKVYASDILKLKEEKYELKMEDPATVGDILHRTIQRALKEAKSIEKISLKRLNEILKYEIYVVYAKRNDAPPKHYLDHIYKTYEKSIGDFLSAFEMLNKFEFDSMEEDTKGSIQHGNVVYHGKADLVLKNQERDYAVIDMKKDDTKYYKATSLEKTSLQVAMYSDLLETNPNYGKTPVFGGYYSFKNSKLHRVWPGGGKKEVWDIELVKQDKNERLEKISQKVADADFKAHTDSETCRTCPYKTLCRGGYEIK